MILDARLFHINRRLWQLAAAMMIAALLGLLVTGIGLDLSRVALFFLVLALCLGLSAFYRLVRRDDLLFFLGQIASQMLIITLAVGILSYLSQTPNLPLIDKTLIAIDRALGFDWHGYIAWVDTKPMLARLFTFAYFSSGPQSVLIIALLFWYKQIGHIQRYMAAFTLTALITIVLSMLLPAVAGYVHYDVDVAATYTNLRPAAARVHEAPLMALREGAVHTLTFPLQGLVTFPSFHSALSILLIYAGWTVLWLRFALLALNTAVIFATPVDGGHWLIDVIAGVAIAVLVIAWVEKTMKAAPR